MVIWAGVLSAIAVQCVNEKCYECVICPCQRGELSCIGGRSSFMVLVDGNGSFLLFWFR